MLKIYNTFTQQKEIFVPIVPNHVGLYVCGITVYDYCHIGHARVMIVFDVVTRYLRSQGYTVRYIRNITDIDDKIIARANELQIDYQLLTTRFIDAMHDDFEGLGILPCDVEPRATEYIDKIQQMIATLIEKGFAYVGENGDVYYRVAQFKAYGELSHKHLDGLQAGARVDVSGCKQGPLDFVLWKRAKQGEPYWPSPWGDGRPGWHIECSAMSTDCLGSHFDIHGGGADLQFPHHENEIAQSEAATGQTFVNTWMHIGFLQVDSEKMSKSLGNFFTIQEVSSHYHFETIRFFMLSSHYRSPLNFSSQALDAAQAGLERFYLALRDLEEASPLTGSRWETEFNQAMDDDFNTPVALAVLFDLTKEINRQKEVHSTEVASLGSLLKKLSQTFGLLTLSPEEFLQTAKNTIRTEEIEAKILLRQEARLQKDWSLSDRIRDELLAKGVLLEDKADKTVWRWKK